MLPYIILETLILHIILLSVIFYFIFISEGIYIIINILVLLIVTSFIGLNQEADIYINFLLILDLGVLLTLLVFTLNLDLVFINNNFTYFNFKVILLILTLLSVYITKYTTFLHSSHSLISYLNLYNLFFNNYTSDLQLVSELYFTYVPYEFILFNLMLYLTIITFILLLNVNYYFRISGNSFLYKHLYLRNQNIQYQVNKSLTVRVWSKNFKRTDN